MREAEEARLWPCWNKAAVVKPNSVHSAAEEERQRAQANRQEAAAPPPLSAPTAAVRLLSLKYEPVAEEAENLDGAAPAPRRFTPVEAPKRP